MKVTFRTSCYGCRRGARWNGQCLWRAHRYDWSYYIACDGRRLVQRTAFRSFDLAWRSAQRSWFKLTSNACISAGDAR